MFIFLSNSGLFLPEASGKLRGDKDNLAPDGRSHCAPENYVNKPFDLIWITRASRCGDKNPFSNSTTGRVKGAE